MIKKRLDWLWDDGMKKLLDDLKEQRKKHRGDKRDTITKLIRYISAKEKEISYDVFRAKGYKVGSGAVEDTCKHVVGKRLKQSGMIWSRAGLPATLALRITWLNNKYEKSR